MLIAKGQCLLVEIFNPSIETSMPEILVACKKAHSLIFNFPVSISLSPVPQILATLLL